MLISDVSDSVNTWGMSSSQGSHIGAKLHQLENYGKYRSKIFLEMHKTEQASLRVMRRLL